MIKNMNQSAQVASHQLQALAHQERAMLDNVLAAIKSAFSNEPDVNHTLGMFKERGAAISHSLLATINRHPLASALSVVGIGCMLYGLRRGAADNWSAFHQSRASYGVDPEYIDEWGEPLTAPERVEGNAKDTLRDIKARADEFAPEARRFARDVGARASQVANEAEASAESLGKNLQTRSQQLTETARDTIRRHPVATGVIGIALGVAVGGAIYGSSRRKSKLDALRSRRLLSDGHFGRASSFFANSSNAAKEALLGAKNRITH